MLTNEEIEAYLLPLTEDQKQSIQAIRSLIIELNPELTEEVDTGKWFGGLLTYHAPERFFVFALGPLSAGFTTFHMMAYYGSSGLQERHSADLKKFLSGKSCIKFKQASELPEAALRDIIAATPKFVEVAREIYAKRKKR
jgi:hypothetical protein